MPASAVIDPPSAFSVARFRFDVTPPLNHPLLGGLVPPVAAVTDSLEAAGYVLLGAEEPIVVCAVDWAALSGGAHLAWRTALAEAANTVPDRVAVQCVHQHNAPLACDESQALVSAQPGMGSIYDADFFDECLVRASTAVRAALDRPRRITHVAHGQALVEQVASNRRVDRDETGHIRAMRKSACDDPALRALPAGQIDPTLQTLALYDGEVRLVACHYYATHPMSYYRDGRVSSDFCGLARKRRQQTEPECLHLYFSGCAGDVAAGKYNDGSPEARVALTDRIYQAIISAETTLTPEPLRTVAWKVQNFLPPPRKDVSPEQLEAIVADSRESDEARRLAAFQLGWFRRYDRGTPLVASSLRLNSLTVLHLPGEMFVDYQLRARAMGEGSPVMVAAYGDDGPWYVPTKDEYRSGGYEVDCAFCDASIDDTLTSAMVRLIG